MAGQAFARDADREVDHRLAAAQPADRKVAHAPGQEGEVLRRRRHDPGELRRQALGLPEHRPGPARCRRGGQVPEAPALGQPVGPPGLLVQGMSAGVASGVVGQQGARHPLGPTGLAVLAAVGDVDHPEQVAPAGSLVHPHQQLAEEQVFVRSRPEQRLQHIAAKQPAPSGGREVLNLIARIHAVQHRSPRRSIPLFGNTCFGTCFGRVLATPLFGYVA